MDILAVLAGGLIGGAANRFAGWEHGNRYVPAVVLWVLLCLGFGLQATVFALAFLFWRTIGWHKSIDMGRNEGSFLRDFATMFGITLLPVASIALMYPTWWLAAFAFIPSLSYAAAMWLLPWRPEFRHIAVAEWVTGGLLGMGAVAVVVA